MRTFAFILALFIPAFSAIAAEDAPQPRQWTVGDVQREGLVYVPASAKTEPTPLVFAFHGHGGTMSLAARSFHIHDLWPEAIVVYLQGLKTAGQLTDPNGERSGWQGGKGKEGDRDLKFFDVVLKDLHDTYKINDRRIYCTGHSNGGGFTYLLWAERGDVFAAVAPSSAVAFAALKQLKPKPVLHIAGSMDNLVKFDWQKRMIDDVRKVNGCEGDGKKDGDLLTLYPSPGGTPVETYIHDGGHVFPKEAPAVIVKFFKDHPADDQGRPASKSAD